VTLASATEEGWLQFVMDLGPLDAEAVEAVFERHGALSITLIDAANEPLLEPAPGTTPLWSDTRIIGLFHAGSDLELLRRDLGESFSFDELPNCRIEQVPERAWEREWLKDFRPMSFGRRLWICPGGHQVDAQDAVVVELDPGLAFGSGSHPTTAMCLEWLDGLDMAGKRLLDFGCGSGILAVAGLLLGAKSALAVDIDDQAVTATLRNARRNKVLDKLTVQWDCEAIGGAFDVAVANILAGPLIENAQRVCSALSGGGNIALSGILEEQAADVIGAYETWIDFAAPRRMDEWVCLSGTKR
jgi:ribosomal protein L11 methyltransferase